MENRVSEVEQEKKKLKEQIEKAAAEIKELQKEKEKIQQMKDTSSSELSK